MSNQEGVTSKDNKVILNWLAHHNPNREDFKDHVFYIFNYAVCIGCFAFVLGATIALILCNIFYTYIVNFISFPVILSFFLICWIPSIFQYSIQIVRKKPFKNRVTKFTIRFLFPIGGIFLIFKSPLLGFITAIPAGYFIVFIRKIKNKALMNE
ncbi:MAG: hypothetical protein ACFFAA_14385 [Promethearchaeota archaeon]